MEGATDPGEAIADAVNEFFGLLFKGFSVSYERLKNNLYHSVTDMGTRRWLRLAAVVVGYILIRPYIDMFFRKWFDYDQKRKKIKEEKRRAAKQAKASANSLRAGNADTEESSEDDEDEEEEAETSGVAEWDRLARKRQKKYVKSLGKEATKLPDGMTHEQLLELLDWSESEDEKKPEPIEEEAKKDQ